MQSCNSIESNTAELYGKIFPLFSKEAFLDLQKTCSTDALKLEKDYFKGKRVLDMGCGGLGYAIAAFLKNGAHEVVAVDISPGNIERMKGLFKEYGEKVKFINADICDLPVDIGKFDIIYSCGVVPVVRDPERAVSNAYDHLGPNGIFIFSVYGKGGLISMMWSALRALRHVLPKEAILRFLKKHWAFASFYVMDYVFVPILNRYTEREARALISSAGFTDVERLKCVATTKGLVRYLQQAQMDHEKFITKLLHGAGWIILKGRRKA